MWGTKLLISPVKIRIFCPRTTKFGPKLAFLPGLAGSFGALLMGRLLVVACGLYRVRHQFTLYHISHNTNMMITKKIQQIGHSMGGGIALAAAGTSPELKLSSISGHHKMFKRQIFINSTSTIFICANIQICNMLTFFVQFSSQISSVFWLEGALRIRRFLFLFFLL